MEASLDKAGKDPTGLFKALYAWKSSRTEAGIKLPEPVKQLFETDEDLVRVGDYISGIDRELDVTESGALLLDDVAFAPRGLCE